MKIDVQNHGTVTVLVPHGPLIGDDVPEFARGVTTAVGDKQGRVVIDCVDVPYLDSAGIESLLTVVSRAATAHRPRLTNLTDTCREALDLTNVLDRLEIFETVESAIRSYKR